MDKTKLRIGILGLKNSGKSTLVNAWVRHTVTEASVVDCTKCKHNFILTKEADTEDGCKARDAILARIKELNTDSNKDATREGHVDFELPLREDLITPCKDDVSFIITDFPCNEQTPDVIKKVYSDRFDMLIVLLDTSGAMTEEFEKQKKLLQDIKNEMDTLKAEDRPSLIIGINKVDDLSDEDTIRDRDKEIETIQETFGVEDRVDSLEELLKDSNMDRIELDDKFFPIVVPLSAKNALFYRQFEGADETFSRFEDKVVEKLAKKIFGCKFNELVANKENIRIKTFEELAKGTCLDDFLTDTGFPKLERAIATCLEGANRQGYIISKQLRSYMIQNMVVDSLGGYTLEFKENVLRQIEICPCFKGESNFEIYKLFFDNHLKLSKKEFEEKAITEGFYRCFLELAEFEVSAFELFFPKKPNGGAHGDDGNATNLVNDIEKWIHEAKFRIFQVQLEVIKGFCTGKLYTTEAKRDSLEPIKLLLSTSDLCSRYAKERRWIDHWLLQNQRGGDDSIDSKDQGWVFLGECLCAELEKMKKQEIKREVDIASKRSHDALMEELSNIKNKHMEEFSDIKSSLSDLLERLPKIQKTSGDKNDATSTTLRVGVEGGSSADPLPTSSSSPKSIMDMKDQAANNKIVAAGTTKLKNSNSIMKAHEEEGQASDEGSNVNDAGVDEEEAVMVENGCGQLVLTVDDDNVVMT